MTAASSSVNSSSLLFCFLFAKQIKIKEQVLKRCRINFLRTCRLSAILFFRHFAFSQKRPHHALNFNDFLHLRFVQPKKFNFFLNESSTKEKNALPSQVFFIVILQKNFTFTNGPSFHLQSNQKQSTIIFGYFHVFVEIECQKLVAARIISELIIMANK